MKKVNNGQYAKELLLFHGTDVKHIDAICDQNFDWRICGTHGTFYGQGTYFARHAMNSHKFTVPTSSGTRMMFIARVLVGDYVTGDPQMKRPPLKPGSSTRYYDSCVNNVTKPQIFVVFEKHQIYPEYLLEYEEQKKA
ncbi:protein mono-ADP-ribosyltransferase PARP12-like [Anomaloglossus baeobatrachus]